MKYQCITDYIYSRSYGYSKTFKYIKHEIEHDKKYKFRLYNFYTFHTKVGDCDFYHFYHAKSQYRSIDKLLKIYTTLKDEYITNSQVVDVFNGNTNVLIGSGTNMSPNPNNHIITPNMAFLLTWMSLDNKSMLVELFSQWCLLDNPHDEIKWIKSLICFSNKTFEMNVVCATLYIFFEKYHFAVFLNDITRCTSLITFEFYIDYTPLPQMEQLDYEDINDVLKCDIFSHARLIVKSKKNLYLYDPDVINSGEIQSYHKYNKYINLTMFNIPPIQELTNDSLCMFHCISFILIMLRYNGGHVDDCNGVSLSEYVTNKLTFTYTKKLIKTLYRIEYG